MPPVPTAQLDALGFVPNGPGRWWLVAASAEAVVARTPAGWRVSVVVRGKEQWSERPADPAALASAAAFAANSVRRSAAARAKRQAVNRVIGKPTAESSEHVRLVIE